MVSVTRGAWQWMVPSAEFISSLGLSATVHRSEGIILACSITLHPLQVGSSALSWMASVLCFWFWPFTFNGFSFMLLSIYIYAFGRPVCFQTYMFLLSSTMPNKYGFLAGFSAVVPSGCCANYGAEP